jgi:hypothetical protein
MWLFLDFDLDFGEGSDDIVQYISLSNEKSGIRYDYETLIFVRLTEFKKTLGECESFWDKLLFSLRHAHEYKEKPIELEGKFFDRLFEVAKITNFTEEEFAKYEASRMHKWDQYASMKWARKKGRAEGREEGRTEGVAIGEARGVAIGRTEVLDLLAKGYSVEQIKDALNGKQF